MTDGPELPEALVMLLDAEKKAYARGRADERADVVAWLKQGATKQTIEGVVLLAFTEAIEAARHEGAAKEANDGE